LHKPPELTESPFKGKTGIARIIQATWNSFAGLADAWKHESAFRQEVLLAVVLVPSALFLPLDRVEKALLIASVLLVLIVELLNSGIEAAIDRVSFELHDLSKRAKDLASAAVFLSLVLCAGIWLSALWQRLAG